MRLNWALGHPNHSERSRRSLCLLLAAGGKENIAPTLTIHFERLLDCRGQVFREWRKKFVAAEQGVADRYGGECRMRTLVAVEDEAAAAGVPDLPETPGGEERELEVGGFGDGAGGGRGGVWRLRGVEQRGEGVEAEQGRRLERVQAAEEGVAGDDAVERGVGRAGAAQVLEGGEPDEDLCEDVVAEGHHLTRRRQRCHREPGTYAGEALGEWG